MQSCWFRHELPSVLINYEKPQGGLKTVRGLAPQVRRLEGFDAMAGKP